MITSARRNPGAHPLPETAEPPAAYSEIPHDVMNGPEIDWHAAESDRMAEQTLGTSRAF